MSACKVWKPIGVKWKPFFGFEYFYENLKI